MARAAVTKGLWMGAFIAAGAAPRSLLTPAAGLLLGAPPPSPRSHGPDLSHRRRSEDSPSGGGVKPIG